MKNKKNFSDTYITKFGWMVEITESHFESDLLAIIYGFSQDGETWFTGSLSYLQKWLGCSRSTVIRNLSTLTQKNILIKDSTTVNNITFNKYRVDLLSIQNLRTPRITETPGGITETPGGGVTETPNNTISNNTNRESATEKHNIRTAKQLIEPITKEIASDVDLRYQAQEIGTDYNLHGNQVKQLILEVLLERQQKGEVLKLILPKSDTQKIVWYMQLFARARRFAEYSAEKGRAVNHYGKKKQNYEPEKL